MLIFQITVIYLVDGVLCMRLKALAIMFILIVCIPPYNRRAHQKSLAPMISDGDHTDISMFSGEKIKEITPTDNNYEKTYADHVFPELPLRPKYFGLAPYYPTIYGGSEEPDIHYSYSIGPDGGTIEVNILFDEPKTIPLVIDGERYELIVVEGCGFYGRYGDPLVPEYGLIVALPTKSDVPEVDVSGYMVKYFGRHNIVPRQKPVPIGGHTEHLEFIKNVKTYRMKYIYPRQIMGRYTVGYMRGIPLVRIPLYPIRVIPSSGKTYFYYFLQVTIRFSIPENYRPGTYDKKSLNFVSELLGDNIVGIREAISYSEDIFGQRKTLRGSYDYVIVTADTFYDIARRYAELKSHKNIDVFIANLSWIKSNYGGVDVPEKIRNFIIDAYSSWGIKYVLIIGDADYVPPREVVDPYPYSGAPDIDNGTIPTDMYYACLDGTWNDDGDGNWGEREDNVDWYPEVIVGRIPGDTREEIERAIGRLILYEFAPSSGQWRRRALLLGAQAFDVDDGAEFFNRMIQNYIQYTDYEPIKLYDTEKSPMDNLTTENTIDWIRNGVAIVNFWDHGSPDTWWQNVESTGGDPLLSSHHVYENITIRDTMYPFIFAMACSTVPFDHEDMDNNIGESWFRSSIAGAIGYVGASRIAFGGDDGLEGLNERWWSTIKEFWIDNRTQPTGVLIIRARNELAKDYDPDTSTISRKTLLETALIGDPEISILVSDGLNITLANKTIIADPGDTVTIVGNVTNTTTGNGVSSTIKVWIFDPVGQNITYLVANSYPNGTFRINIPIPSDTPPRYYFLGVFAELNGEIGRVGIRVKIGSLNVSLIHERFVPLDSALNITGRVVSKDGSPVPNAIVNISIYDVYGALADEATVYTNSSGYYTYQWIVEEASEYTISIVTCDQSRIMYGFNESEFIAARDIIRVGILDSWGADAYPTYTSFQFIEEEWYKYGEYMIVFDASSLNKEGIGISDMLHSNVDVLFISDAHSSNYGWEFTDDEIDAIKLFVRAGHGIIATSGTLSTNAANNMKLAEIFGYSNETPGYWAEEYNRVFSILNASHPLFAGIVAPYDSGINLTITDLKYSKISPPNVLARSTDDMAEIVEHVYGNGMAIYFTHMPELYYPPYGYKPTYEDIKVLYNSLVWVFTQSSPVPYEVIVDNVKAPILVDISETIYINVTLVNIGGEDIGSAIARLLVDGEEVDNKVISIPAGEQVLVEFNYTPTIYRRSNITIVVDEIPGEISTANNHKSTTIIIAKKIFDDDLEGPGSWVASGSNVSWEWGRPTYGPPSAHSGQYCWATNITGPYKNNENSILRSPPIEIPANASETYVMFYHWFEIEDTYDSARFMVYDGTSWNILYPIYGPNYTDVLFGDGWTGYSGGWNVSLFDISDFRGKTIYLGFNFTSDYSVTRSGWYVDDVVVAYISYEHQLIIEKIHTDAFLDYGRPSVINVTVSNTGINDESNIDVELYLRDNLVDKKTINIGSMEKINVTFQIILNKSHVGELKITARIETVPNELITDDNEKTMSAWGGIIAYSSDFEIPPGDEWYKSGKLSSWEWGVVSSGPGSAYSGARCWATNVDGRYNNDEDSRLVFNISKVEKIIGSVDIYFRFYTWYSIETWYDGARVEYSMDASAWGTITPKRGPSYGNTQWGSAWTGYSSDWRYTMFEIHNISGGYIGFRMISDSWVTYDGIYIDDFSLLLAMYPKTRIVDPANDSYVGPNIAISWITMGAGYVDHYEIYLDGSPINSSIPPTETEYIITDLPGGEHTIELLMIDILGEVSRSIIKVNTDLYTPTIIITSPKNNTVFAADGSYVWEEIRWDASDDSGIDHFEIYLDGQAVTTNIPPDKTYYLLRLPKGRHKVSVRAVDLFGNINESTIFVAVDTSVPMISMESPINGSALNRGTIYVSWNSSDDIGIDHFEIYANGSLIASNIPSTYNGYNITLGDGLWWITVKAVDLANRSADDSVMVLIDTTPPHLVIISPENMSELTTGEVTIEWSAEDPSGIDHFELYVDGELIEGNISADITEYKVTLGEGTHRITVKAIDGLGNTGEATITIKVMTRTREMKNIFTYSLIATLVLLVVIGVIVLRLKRKKVEA